MALAIFDLDHTLLSDDSDYLWGEYMVANHIVDEAHYRKKNKLYYQDYQAGQLDNDEYLAFALYPLTQHPIEKLYAWRNDFVQTWIKPVIAKGSAELLQKHRSRGDTLIIVSATNLFVTAPIAELLDIPHVLSTEPELLNNRYTGRYLGTPTYKEGKVAVLKQWLADTGHDLQGSYFYSDSLNDLPLLEQVNTPVAVNPNPDLLEIAKARQWQIMDLRK